MPCLPGKKAIRRNLTKMREFSREVMERIKNAKHVAADLIRNCRQHRALVRLKCVAIHVNFDGCHDASPYLG
jgi:hypothetical protein